MELFSLELGEDKGANTFLEYVSPKVNVRGVGEGTTPFPGLLHFTIDPYLYSAKQGGIKYHF